MSMPQEILSALLPERASAEVRWKIVCNLMSLPLGIAPTADLESVCAGR